MTDQRLLAILPTLGLSLGTTGIPEPNLTRIAGAGVSEQLRRLADEGQVVELHPGRWAATGQ